MTLSRRFLVAALVALASSGPHAVSSGVVISQVYGGGGNTGAPYQNDFVELFNRGSSPISLAGWSVQYTSATGTGHFSGSVTNLSGTLAPGQYYLVRLASQAAVGAPLPAADATGTTQMSATGGKVLVANTTTGLACNGSTTPCDAGQLAQIVDRVGWGTANFFEGAAPAPTTSNTTAIVRGGNGCAETDANGSDFAVAAPAPRNTSSPVAPCVSDVPPTVSSTLPAGGAANVALAADITVTFSEPVTVTLSAFNLSCGVSGGHALTASGGPTTFTLDPVADFGPGETCTLTVRATEVTDQDGPADPMAGDALVTFSTLESCGDPATAISAIQGSGLTSVLAGMSVAIQGVVVGDYQADGQLGGFFVQEEDSDADADATTSEGLFVFSADPPVSVGDAVRVRGAVHEFSSSGTFLTELSPVTGVAVCASGTPLPAPATVTMPVATVSEWERYEGMRVAIPQALTVTDTFTLARFGELELSANGRLQQPTNVAAPGASAAAVQALNDRSRIVLDDANNQQNIDPTLYPLGGLAAANTVRTGDTIAALTGVLEQRFGVYRIQPVGPIAITHGNLRPAPPVAAGTLRVASFNVLNYFNGDGLGGGFPTPRGANSLAEFDRQRAKTIAAIRTMDADIVGLMELENDAAGNSAIEDLVNGLNAATAPGTYAFIDTGVVGTDEIRVGLLYKPASVTPYHTFAILDSSVDPDFIDTKNRPSLAQTFTQNSNGKRVTVVVNHLKSKGSDCDDVDDPDTGDGQGNCNVTRTKAATALVEWLAGDPTGAGDPDVLIIGDLNAYAQEDPVTAITSAGFTDLITTHVGAAGYSYVFDGQSGYLDHALARNGLAAKVTNVLEWHINADEPIALDYNVEFKTPNQVTTFYQPDEFRSSDHDPVIVTLNLAPSFTWTPFGILANTRTVVLAGATAPLVFGLGGNQGLSIFAAGSPASAPIGCSGGSPGAFVPAEAASGSGLTYDAGSGRYTFAWKTLASWRGGCRQIKVTLTDGSSHTAVVSFARAASPAAP